MMLTDLEGLLIDAERLARYEKTQFGGAGLENNCDVDVPKFTALFERHPGLIHDRTDGAVISAENHVIIRRWTQTKTVYHFDADLLRELEATEDARLYPELLRRLPFSAFFLDFGFEPAPEADASLGAFVLIEPGADNSVALGLVDVSDYDPERHAYRNISTMFRISDGESLSEAVAGAFRESSGGIAPEKLREMNRRTLRVLQCAYYLAAQNAEIEPVRTAKKDRPKREDGRRMNLRRWNVGFRIGQAFREAAAEPQGSVTKDLPARNRPRAHVRRAHWHHYWCGEGRTRLELRWIEPVFVNTCGKTGDEPAPEEHRIVATGHAVLH